MPKPTILLVGGAFHPESYFRSLKVTIEQAGYPTSALSLPSAGAYPPECDFSEDVFAIRSRACELVSKGKRVVAVLHSYGAVPGIEALQGLGTPARKEKGVVFGLVFIAAMLPKKGDSFNKLMESLGNTTWKSMQERVGFLQSGSMRLQKEISADMFFNDLEPGYQSDMTLLVQEQSIGVLNSPITHETYRDIPSAYLLTLKDQAFRYEDQLEAVHRAGILVTVEVDTGHVPWLKRPTEARDFILNFAFGLDVQRKK